MNEDMFPNGKNTVLGPGRLLQIAREEKNLRPEDVAYEIRLTPSQVLALDEDDYSKMPEETYVRGYLRNYARLVGVPENEILMAFARMTRATDTVPIQASMPAESENNKKSNATWMVAVAGIVAVIVFSAVWVLEPYNELSLTDSSSDSPIVNEKPVLEEVPVGISTLNLDKSAGDPGLADTGLADSGLNESPALPATEPEVVSENTIEPELAPDNANLPELVSGTETETPALAISATSTPEISENIAQTVEATNTSNDLNDTGGLLIINYSRDSWTDVRDANGKKLLYRTVKAGEKISLAGDLPISLFFGFAQGVEVKFKGKIINVESHTRGVFARFTVGEAVTQ
ncbi:MAG: RodZ domain-containing protein [Arenicellales bacterium]